MRSASVRVLLWAAASLILGWGLIDPRFRDAEGALHAIVGLPIALAASVGVVAATWFGSWRRSGQWIAIALLGQAAALQLVHAGSGVGYQHYQSPMANPATLRALLVGWLAVQTAAVAAGLSSRWPSIRQWCGRSFRLWQLLAIGMLFALSSATLSRSILTLLALSFIRFWVVFSYGYQPLGEGRSDTRAHGGNREAQFGCLRRTGVSIHEYMVDGNWRRAILA